jgi:heat shock protein HslJ
MPVMRYVVMVSAVVAILWPVHAPKASGRLAGTEWRIVEIHGAKVTGGGTLRFTQSTVRGKAECNAFFGAFRETAETIEIGGLNATRMACAGKMEAEQSVLSGLERAKSYRVEGRNLLLIDAEGNPVLRLAE